MSAWLFAVANLHFAKKIPLPPEDRKCGVCGKVYPLKTGFYTKGYGPHGVKHSYYCKLCDNQRNRDRRARMK